jgi:hypothetical protein
VLFIISNYLTWARVPSIYVVNNCAGHFKQTQSRSILESLINIFVSIFAVFNWGIYGVLIGTIVALLYRTNDMIIYSAKHILGRSIWKSYKQLLINTIWLVCTCFIGATLLPQINSYSFLFICAVVYGVIIAISIILINYLTNKNVFSTIINEILKPKVSSTVNVNSCE